MQTRALVQEEEAEVTSRKESSPFALFVIRKPIDATPL